MHILISLALVGLFSSEDMDQRMELEEILGQEPIDRFELFHPYRFTFVEMHDRLFVLSLEANALVELNLEGEVIREYVAQSGSGPGDVTQPRVVFPYEDGFAILNYENGQFVVLDKDLKYRENFKANFDAKLGFFHQGDYLAFLTGGRNILGLIDSKSLKLKRFALKRRLTSNPLDAMKVSIAQGYIFYYSPAFTDEQNFPVIPGYDYTRDFDNINLDTPRLVLASPELPELFKEGFGKGRRGYIANIEGFKDKIIVENVIADRKNEMRALDIFDRDGRFLKRIVTHLSMVGSPMSDDVYFLDTHKVLRLVDLKLD